MKPKGKPVIWSAQIAYAVGLITTDGNLSPDGRHINLTSKDVEQINNFKTCLGLTNKIGKKARGGETEKKYYVLQFGNVVFYRWLLEIGLMPNKSKIIGPLKIPDKYFFEFLRGHLDGDGCIRKYQDKVFPKSQRLYVNFYSASLKHLEWLKQKITQLMNIKGYIRIREDICDLTYAKKESSVLIPHIYSNKSIPYLTRKHTIVDSFL